VDEGDLWWPWRGSDATPLADYGEIMTGPACRLIVSLRGAVCNVNTPPPMSAALSIKTELSAKDRRLGCLLIITTTVQSKEL